MKQNTKHTSISSQVSDYLSPQGKLTELGIMLIVDALLINQEDLIPAQVLEYLQKHPDVQEDVFEYYQAMRQLNTSYLRTHPYFNGTSRQRLRHRKQLRIKSAILLLGMLFGVYWMIYFVKRIDHFEAKSTSNAEINAVGSPQLDPVDIQLDYIQFDQNKQKLIVPKSQAKKFILANGSEIIIPAEAFVNQDGKKIQEDVEIKYREFHKAAEIIASKIPMDYDSAGVNYPFESAGMFEIRAFQEDGQEAFIASDKSIQVNMAADGSEEGFNHYYLEESDKQEPQWKLLGASVLKKEVEQEDLQEVQEESPLFRPIPDSLRLSTNKPDNPYEIFQPEISISPILEVDSTFNPTFQLNLNLVNVQDLIIPHKDRCWNLDCRGDTEQSFLNKHPYAKPSDRRFITGIPYYEEKQFKALEDYYWQWIDMDNVSENPFANTWVLNDEWNHMKLYPVTEANYQHTTMSIPDQIMHMPLSRKSYYTPTHFEPQIQFSDDEKYLLFATRLGEAQLINLESGESKTLEGAWTAHFTPDDQYVITSLDDVKIWSLDGELLHNFGTPEYGVKSIRVSPDSQYILIASKNNQVRLYDIRGQFISRIWAGTENYDYALSTFEVKDLVSEDAYFTPDSRYVLVKSQKGDFKAWSITGKPLDWKKSQIDSSVSLIDIFENPKVLDQFVRDPEKIKEIFSDIESHQDYKLMLEKNVDFHVTNHKKSLQTTHPRLLSLLTGIKNHKLKGGYFSKKGTYMITEKKDSLTSDSLKESSTDPKFKLWKRSQNTNSSEELFVMVLNKYTSKSDTTSIYLAPAGITPNGEINNKQSFEMIVKRSKYQSPADKRDVKRILKVYQKTTSKTREISQALAQNTEKLYRVFEVKQLGVYNVDRIYKMKNLVSLKANFQWDNPIKDLQIPLRVYHICGKNQSVVIPYNLSNNTEFRFNPNDQNQLIAILPDSRVAYFKPKDFEKINIGFVKARHKYTFQMHTQAITGTLDELKAILN